MGSAFEEELEALSAIFGDDEGNEAPMFVEGCATLAREFRLESFKAFVDGVDENLFVVQPGKFQMELCIRIPEEYPEQPPELYSIKPLWFPQTLIKLIEQEFAQVLEINQGQVVFFQLWQMLQDFDPNKHFRDAPTVSLPNLFFKEEEYHGLTLEKYVKTFAEQTWTCGICFSDFLGLEMHQLPDCKHYFCIGCMTEFISMHIAEASVRSMACPEPSCKAEIPPSSVQSLVNPKQYERYDQLMLIRALNKMQDLAYCPQKNCGVPTVVPKGIKVAKCPSCTYHFCLLCFGAYHGLTTCPVFLTESEREKLSLVYVMQTGKHCPSCNTIIEKNGGCDHMYCTLCNTNFSWSAAKQAGSGNQTADRALRVALGSSSAPLVDPPAGSQRVRTRPAVPSAPAPEATSQPCPRCHLRRGKHSTASGDMIYCLNCQKGFCFHCGNGLQESHFIRGLCKLRTK